MTSVVIDFETRSTTDLVDCGIDRYAEDPHTAVLCLAYAFNDEPAQVWVPATSPFYRAADHGDGRMPDRLRAHILAGGRVVAHNAHFELVIWAMMHRRHPAEWPPLRAEQVTCTMVRGRALALPGNLENMAKALRLPVEKDMEGNAVMKKLMKPHTRGGKLVWIGDAAMFDRMCTYAAADIEAEREADKVLPELPDAERELWLADYRINRRGVQIDTATVLKATETADHEKRHLSHEVAKLTGGVTATQRDALLAWLQAQGLAIDNTQAATIAKVLARSDLSPVVRRVLELRQDAALTSPAKLQAMLAGANADGKARGLLVMNGADTGRAAGRRIQTQNMPRTPDHFTADDASAMAQYLRYPGARRLITREFGSVMKAISWSLRSMLTASPGNRLISCDYSNIEGRVLAWLAGEQWKLDAFAEFDAGLGPDLYVVAYARAFGLDPKDVTKAMRQIGKVMELALGYQGGHKAFISMGANYGVNVDDIARALVDVADPDQWARYVKEYRDASGPLPAAPIEPRYPRPPEGVADRAWDKFDEDQAAWEKRKERRARIRSLGLTEAAYAAVKVIYMNWRAAHKNIRAFWYDLEGAAVAAVAEPGKAFHVGRVAYMVDGDFLMCRLPSGRCLAYGYPHLKGERDQYGKPKNGLRVHGTVGKNYVRWAPYGGLLAENVTQAVARDILMEAILRLERRGYPVVMHVHDEAVCDVPNGFGSLAEMRRIMCDAPIHHRGFPLAAAGWEGARYRKD